MDQQNNQLLFRVIHRDARQSVWFALALCVFVFVPAVYVRADRPSRLPDVSSSPGRRLLNQRGSLILSSGEDPAELDGAIDGTTFKEFQQAQSRLRQTEHDPDLFSLSLVKQTQLDHTFDLIDKARSQRDRRQPAWSGGQVALDQPSASHRSTATPQLQDRFIEAPPLPSLVNRSDVFRAASSGNKDQKKQSKYDPVVPQTRPIYMNDFSPTPVPNDSICHDSAREQWVYDTKEDVPTQLPFTVWGPEFYADGITRRGINWFGKTSMVRSEFYVYGDWRTAAIAGRNAAGRTDNVATLLNLDFDLQVTDTERFHMFIGPLNRGGNVTRFDYVDDNFRFRNELDVTPVTGYFEGDFGPIIGGLQGKSSRKEVPFTIGLIPLLFQNGIWMEDAVTGAAFAIPSQHSKLLNISNFDTTFFAAVDQVNSPAFGNDEHAAMAFGGATFIEAWGGYVEAGYAFLYDRNRLGRSYHNTTFSYTRRYRHRISNGLRVILNSGQDLAQADRTADGALFLFESSYITAQPLTVVPYFNFFVGWDRPQSVARAGGSGGILRNQGLTFDTDGLNGFATLDPTGSDTAGGTIGIDLIGDDLDSQLVLEASYLTPHGSQNPNVPDDQFGLGARLQLKLSHRTLVRFDVMHGWRRGLEDVYGTRMEYRWKF